MNQVLPDSTPCIWRGSPHDTTNIVDRSENYIHSLACGQGGFVDAPGGSESGVCNWPRDLGFWRGPHLAFDDLILGGSPNSGHVMASNYGSDPETNGELRLYYGEPRLVHRPPLTDMTLFGSMGGIAIAPNDSITLGPFSYSPPVAGNSFGENLWSLVAVYEAPDDSVRDGWPSLDNAVALRNAWRIEETGPGPTVGHVLASNPDTVAQRIVLSVDTSGLPLAWSVGLVPPAGVPLLLGPGDDLPVVFSVFHSGPAPSGTFDIVQDTADPSGDACPSGLRGGAKITVDVPGSPVSTLIARFEIDAAFQEVRLVWDVADASSLRGFHVYRGDSRDGSFRRLDSGMITPDARSYVDATVVAGRAYWYRLGVVDGEEEFLSPARSVRVPRGVLALGPVYPNPFNPATTIHYVIPEDGARSLRIHDAQGRLVSVLADGFARAGEHTLPWDGRDNLGRPVASGVYFVTLRFGETVRSEKIVLIR